MIAEALIPIMIFGARPMTRRIFFGVLGFFNDGLQDKKLSFKDAKKQLKKLKNKAKKSRQDRKRIKTLKKRLPDLKKDFKKAAPNSAYTAKIAGMTAGLIVSFLALSNLKLQFGHNSKAGTYAQIVHDHEANWFHIGSLGIGHTSAKTLVKIGHNEDDGLYCDAKLHGYKHAPEIYHSFMIASGVGLGVYGALFGLCTGARRVRQYIEQEKGPLLLPAASRALSLASIILPPTAYFYASGFEIHPIKETHGYTTRLAVNLDYDSRNALIQFGRLSNIISVDSTFNDFTLAYLRMDCTWPDEETGEKSDCEITGRVHPKVTRAFKNADKQHTKDVAKGIEKYVPDLFGKDTLKSAATLELFRD